jgi:glycosyltransferase involved in cell wall biosynthesis
MDPRERYKGHDELLAALADLPAARLVVAGDGDDRGRLEARARSLGLEDRAAFTGFVSEATLAALYSRCAAFVMPSRGEGFGLVYLEAMRAGKPVVAARGSAAEEIVVDGVTGLLVDPEDRAALAGAVAALLDDPEKAERMGMAGRERYRDEFGWERFYSRMEGLLERLCAGSTGSSG